MKRCLVFFCGLALLAVLASAADEEASLPAVEVDGLLANNPLTVEEDEKHLRRSLMGIDENSGSFEWNCGAVHRLGTPASDLCCDMCKCLMGEHPAYALAPSFPSFCMMTCKACVKDAAKCGGDDKLPLVCASVLFSKTNKETISKCIDIYYAGGCQDGTCASKLDKCPYCCNGGQGTGPIQWNGAE